MRYYEDGGSGQWRSSNTFANIVYIVSVMGVAYSVQGRLQVSPESLRYIYTLYSMTFFLSL